MPTPKTTEIIDHMLESLEHPYKPLSDWEKTFIASIRDQFDQRGTLSDKQFAKLETIYAEKTA